MLFVAVFSVGMVGSIWITQEYSKFTSELVEQKNTFLEGQKAAIKQEVDRVLAYIDFKRATTEQQLKDSIKARVYEAVALVENIYTTYQGQKSDEEIQHIIKEALRPLRFNNGRGYYFIYDMQGKNVLLPSLPEQEGKNLWDFKDSKGGYTIQNAIKIIRESGEGFQRWYFYKPGETEKMSEKIGFHKKFEPYDWWIGTGEYLEDVEKDIQRETLEWINKVRFGEDGYVFVYDFDAVTLAHFKPGNIGINQWNFRDANGIYVLRDLIRISQQEGGGFLNYVGTIQPSTGQPAAKLGYARAVEDWRWMVGTGVYVESINVIISQKHEVLIGKIKKSLIAIFVILLFSLVIIWFILKYISNKTSDNLGIFTQFFKKAATESLQISDDSVYFTEFQSLAHSANQMVEERNRASDSLQKLQEQLIRSRKMESLGVLAGGVAHDLNNVLSAIVGYPDLLLADLPQDSPQRKYIENIKDSGLKAASIVQDLLTLARRGVAQRVTLNLNSIIENYLQSPEHQKIMMDNPGVDLTSDLQSELMMVNGSHVHLQKTVVNLVANAAEAQPNGGSIHIATENRYMDHQVDTYSKLKEGEYVSMTIADKGFGIAPQDLEHIFEPFFSKKQPGKSGTGLGMAVVWGTVQDHDGFINVITNENKGTTFELYFPATRESIKDSIKAEDIDNLHGNGESILIVDDLHEQRELAKEILNKLGYAAETVDSGEAALEYLKNHKVDLLVLDMVMDPGIDGLETYKQSLKLNPKQK